MAGQMQALWRTCAAMLWQRCAFDCLASRLVAVCPSVKLSVLLGESSAAALVQMCSGMLALLQLQVLLQYISRHLAHATLSPADLKLPNALHPGFGCPGDIRAIGSDGKGKGPLKCKKGKCVKAEGKRGKKGDQCSGKGVECAAKHFA